MRTTIAATALRHGVVVWWSTLGPKWHEWLNENGWKQGKAAVTVAARRKENKANEIFLKRRVTLEPSRRWCIRRKNNIVLISFPPHSLSVFIRFEAPQQPPASRSWKCCCLLHDSCKQQRPTRQTHTPATGRTASSRHDIFSIFSRHSFPLSSSFATPPPATVLISVVLKRNSHDCKHNTAQSKANETQDEEKEVREDEIKKKKSNNNNIWIYRQS